MKKFTTRLVFTGLFFVLCLGYSFAQNGPTVVSITGHLVRTTPKIADIDKNSMYGQPLVTTRDKDGIIGISKNLEETEERLEEKFSANKTGKVYDVKNPGMLSRQGNTTLQTPTTTLGVNFDGGTSPGLSPTDNNLAVGPNHVIQIVNDGQGSRFYIWNKTGTLLNPGGTVLATVTGFSGYGDPVVLYDHLADRWFLSEFGPSSCCNNLTIAVSTSGDPMGTYKIYHYVDASFFPDYPKYSVWHNAYYGTTNDFNSSGTAYLGSSVYAFDRSAMLAGAATATEIRIRQNDGGNNYYNMGTIGLEGNTPSTQNGLFAVPVPSNTVNLFELTPDFTTPSNSVVGPLIPLTVSAFSAPPNGVAQQGSGTTIATLGYRMMFKLNYRNNGGTESILITHTVGNAGLAAVRWYEFRRVAGSWTVYQQGTITGTDGNSRFMGGISMDGQGTIALMYDVSGTTSFPSVKYTGRNSCDPLGQMTLAEQTIINGTSAHTNGRWGDYNTTVNDYPNSGSFWSTSQYGAQRTRVANYTLTNPCAGAVLQANGSTLVTEGCVPPNGVIDPVEAVTVSFCVKNSGNIATTNLVGTLLTSGGVVSPSGPQTYGAIAPNASACQNFSFSNTGICGGSITASLQLQDGPTNYGTITYTFGLGNLVNTTFFAENFDGVSAPALPAGWTATQGVNITGAPLWVTSNAGTPTPVFTSTPNSIYTPDPSNLLENIIETPTIAVPAGGGTRRVTFQNNFNVENTYDGGVLEISINGGSYQDIIAAGGSFVSGAYTATISTAFQNPLAGRQAWSGNSGGFINTTINLPAAAFGQNIKLRFRYGSDNSVGVQGWRVDDVTLVSSVYVCCGVPPPCTISCPANLTVNNSPGQCGANVTLPAATLSGSCGNVSYVPASGFFPLGNTTVTATTQSGSTCSFIVRVVDAQAPGLTCPANQIKSTDANVCTYTTVGTQFDAAATDNCPGVTKAYSLAGVTTGTGASLAGKVFNKGVTTVTWTATDAAGNTSSCSFTVTVNDTQNPTITCPGNATRSTPALSCTYTASGGEFDPTVTTDNCPGVIRAYTLTGATTGTGATTLAGVVFSIGTTTVSWKATDVSSNTSGCSFTVTILDGNLPVITTQPTNKTVCEGSNATFSVVATSPGTITYQWQQWNGTAWVNVATGGNTSSYTVSNVTTAMNTNSYRVLLTSICGNTVTSNFASLYVNKLPTISLSTSRSPALIPGQFVTITADVVPTGGTIVWRKNGVVMTGYDAFKIANLTVDDIGTYDATYTDLNGCVKSSASVTLTAQPYDKLFVYPNPTSGQFQVRFYNAPGQQVSVVIYDAKGAKVYQRSLATGQLAYSRIDVDLAKHASGVYVVDLMDGSGNKISTKRFILSH